LLTLSIKTFGQAKFEIGVEGGITNDKYKINDPLNHLKTAPCIDGGGGGLSFDLIQIKIGFSRPPCSQESPALDTSLKEHKGMSQQTVMIFYISHYELATI